MLSVCRKIAMKVSKYNKTYDTSDGSEQHFKSPDDVEAKRLRCENDADNSRWQDDGAPVKAVTPTTPTRSPAHHPSWSVLSLREMRVALAAWLRGSDDREQHASGQAKSDDARTVTAAKAAVTKIHRDRYRNAWENT
jgi:hypothetical protein